MVRRIPLVPRLFSRAKQILRDFQTRWTSKQNVVLCCDSCSRMQVVPKRAAKRLCQNPLSLSAVTKVKLDINRLTIHHDARLLRLLGLNLDLQRLLELGLLISLYLYWLLVGLLVGLLLVLWCWRGVLLRLHIYIHLRLVG